MQKVKGRTSQTIALIGLRKKKKAWKEKKHTIYIFSTENKKTNLEHHKKNIKYGAWGNQSIHITKMIFKIDKEAMSDKEVSYIFPYYF